MVRSRPKSGSAPAVPRVRPRPNSSSTTTTSGAGVGAAGKKAGSGKRAYVKKGKASSSSGAAAAAAAVATKKIDSRKDRKKKSPVEATPEDDMSSSSDDVDIRIITDSTSITEIPTTKVDFNDDDVDDDDVDDVDYNSDSDRSSDILLRNEENKVDDSNSVCIICGRPSNSSFCSDDCKDVYSMSKEMASSAIVHDMNANNSDCEELNASVLNSDDEEGEWDASWLDGQYFGPDINTIALETEKNIINERSSKIPPTLNASAINEYLPISDTCTKTVLHVQRAKSLLSLTNSALLRNVESSSAGEVMKTLDTTTSSPATASFTSAMETQDVDYDDIQSSSSDYCYDGKSHLLDTFEASLRSQGVLGPDSEVVRDPRLAAVSPGLVCLRNVLSDSYCVLRISDCTILSTFRSLDDVLLFLAGTGAVVRRVTWRRDSAKDFLLNSSSSSNFTSTAAPSELHDEDVAVVVKRNGFEDASIIVRLAARLRRQLALQPLPLDIIARAVKLPEERAKALLDLRKPVCSRSTRAKWLSLSSRFLDHQAIMRPLATLLSFRAHELRRFGTDGVWIDLNALSELEISVAKGWESCSSSAEVEALLMRPTFSPMTVKQVRKAFNHSRFCIWQSLELVEEMLRTVADTPLPENAGHRVRVIAAQEGSTVSFFLYRRADNGLVLNSLCDDNSSAGNIDSESSNVCYNDFLAQCERDEWFDSDDNRGCNGVDISDHPWALSADEVATLNCGLSVPVVPKTPASFGGLSGDGIDLVSRIKTIRSLMDLLVVSEARLATAMSVSTQGIIDILDASHIYPRSECRRRRIIDRVYAWLRAMEAICLVLTGPEKSKPWHDVVDLFSSTATFVYLNPRTKAECDVRPLPVQLRIKQTDSPNRHRVILAPAMVWPPRLSLSFAEKENPIRPHLSASRLREIGKFRDELVSFIMSCLKATTRSDILENEIRLEIEGMTCLDILGRQNLIRACSRCQSRPSSMCALVELHHFFLHATKAVTNASRGGEKLTELAESTAKAASVAPVSISIDNDDLSNVSNVQTCNVSKKLTIPREKPRTRNVGMHMKPKHKPVIRVLPYAMPQRFLTEGDLRRTLAIDAASWAVHVRSVENTSPKMPNGSISIPTVKNSTDASAEAFKINHATTSSAVASNVPPSFSDNTPSVVDTISSDQTNRLSLNEHAANQQPASFEPSQTFPQAPYPVQYYQDSAVYSPMHAAAIASGINVDSNIPYFPPPPHFYMSQFPGPGHVPVEVPPLPQQWYPMHAASYSMPPTMSRIESPAPHSWPTICDGDMSNGYSYGSGGNAY